MPCDPAFIDNVDRRMRNAYREMRNGCADCLSQPKGRLCHPCSIRFAEVIDNPKEELEKLEKEQRG